jgi:hypothetical protein
VSTGNLTTSERRRIGYEDIVLLETKRNKRFDKQCDRSSSEDEDNGIEDDEEDIRNGLGNASKELAEDSSDSDSKEYEFQG